MEPVGRARAPAGPRYAAVLEGGCSHVEHCLPLRRKAASGDLSGRDFGAGQEFLGRGVDNEMALRDVFNDPRENAFAQHESAPCV